MACMNLAVEEFGKEGVSGPSDVLVRGMAVFANSFSGWFEKKEFYSFSILGKRFIASP